MIQQIPKGKVSFLRNESPRLWKGVTGKRHVALGEHDGQRVLAEIDVRGNKMENPNEQTEGTIAYIAM